MKMLKKYVKKKQHFIIMFDLMDLLLNKGCCYKNPYFFILNAAELMKN